MFIKIGSGSYFQKFCNRFIRIHMDNNQHTRRYIKCIIILIRMFTIEMFISYLFNVSEETQIILFNITYIAGMEPVLNLFLALCGLWISYTYQVIYLSLPNKIWPIIHNIYIQRCSRYFLWPWMGPHHFKMVKGSKGPINCAHYVINKSNRFDRLWQHGMIIVDLAIIYINLSAIGIVATSSVRFHFDGPLSIVKLLRMLLFFVNCWKISALAYFMFNVLIIVNILLVLFTYITFIKFSQIKSMLADWCKRYRYQHSRILWRFMIEHSRVFIIVCQMNRIYLPILVATILVSMPSSIYLIGTLFIKSQDRPFLQKLIIFFMILQQWIGLFGCHVICAFYTKKIHQSGPPDLLRANPRIKFHSLPLQLKVNHYIEKFHTKNRYGLTYAKFGLIDMRTFIKHSCLYIKFLSLGLKIIRQM
ncbi:uncharacterized protein LOC142597773 [Dermatophagoides farinae]|uniref:Uncharacterized protein n=1 Tax=Dermatophagoides farinae TaxID=6954 RepID=A0A922L865_DERFA|nr:hypothetical protein DERF_000324 [Dermatophagoides farinae]